ncbi:YlzJ-like family protein [Piscibacillus halophilus]|uniref:YlzJ-like protein n=1 Tax=Piscibacillus halophilus TaxID=571933 RepID=A0A1H8Z3B8_9BACI|nr:YlzJ-like family protein [Piscibacillus halophilus]SEP58989.1 YlzJ-like protein [Piscibacillus halophilus]
MILYTPLNEQEIFEDEDQSVYQFVTVNHATVKLRRDPELNGYQIVHMVSTNPADYLNSELQPGTTYYL